MGWPSIRVMDHELPYVNDVRDLRVYQLSFETSMALFFLSRKFPREETYSLTDQMRKSSRSVCSNLSEAWAKRIYEAHFISKVSDAEGEARETQTWLDYASACDYLETATAVGYRETYDMIIGMLVTMRRNAKKWILHR